MLRWPTSSCDSLARLSIVLALTKNSFQMIDGTCISLDHLQSCAPYITTDIPNPTTLLTSLLNLTALYSIYQVSPTSTMHISNLLFATAATLATASPFAEPISKDDVLPLTCPSNGVSAYSLIQLTKDAKWSNVWTCCPWEYPHLDSKLTKDTSSLQCYLNASKSQTNNLDPDAKRVPVAGKPTACKNGAVECPNNPNGCCKGTEK